MFVPLNAAISAETCAARASTSANLDGDVVAAVGVAVSVAAGACVTAATVGFPVLSIV